MKFFLNRTYDQLQGVADCADNALCPQKLYLDITEDCNLYCQMCRDKISACGDTMARELFARLVDETSPYVRSYSLFNWGEPLLVRDFRERVRYVNGKKRADCNIEISTNGMLLNGDMISFLHEEGVDIIISVDGANKGTFEAIRRGASFDRVMENARAAAFEYADYPLHRAPQFYVSIQKDNQEQLLEIAKLAHSIGIRRFGCGIVTSPAEFAPEQSGALCAELMRAYAFIEESGMFLDAHPTKVGEFVYADGKYQKASGFVVNTICNAPLVSATIDYAGKVYLCCNAGARVGNVANGSFLELWKSAEYQRFRRAVNSADDMPDKCRDCAWVNRN